MFLCDENYCQSGLIGISDVLQDQGALGTAKKFLESLKVERELFSVNIGG